MVRFVAVPNK